MGINPLPLLRTRDTAESLVIQAVVKRATELDKEVWTSRATQIANKVGELFKK